MSASAVAKQIQAVEELLSCVLILRGGKAFALTDEGRALLNTMTDSLVHIVDDWDRRIRPRHGPLHLGALRVFGQFWLAPRVAHLMARRAPGEIAITIFESREELAASSVDLLFMCQPEPPEGAVVHALFPEELRLFSAPHALGPDSPELPVLDFRNTHFWFDSLDDWMQRVGDPSLSARRRVVFPAYELAIQAAESGAGALLGCGNLFSLQVDAQRLAPVGPWCVRTQNHYFAIGRSAARSEAIAQLLVALQDVRPGASWPVSRREHAQGRPCSPAVTPQAFRPDGSHGTD